MFIYIIGYWTLNIYYYFRINTIYNHTVILKLRKYKSDHINNASLPLCSVIRDDLHLNMHSIINVYMHDDLIHTCIVFM